MEEEEEEEEEKEDMDDEPDTANLQAIAINGLGIGICPASFNWRQCRDDFDFGDESDQTVSNCGKCNEPFYWHGGGYRCEGGTHFCCQECVQLAVDDKEADLKRKTKAAI